MEPSAVAVAWLEAKGERWPVSASCSIGRSLTNQVVLPETKVSRRHCLVHSQDANEFWLVDLGSSNGTYLNGRRVSQPTRLRDRDRIAIGDFVLVFRHTSSSDTAIEPTHAEVTLREIKTARCWLLLADMVASTELSKNLTADELSVMTGLWLAECKEIIEKHGGIINKYLGDGFFSYWLDARDADARVADTLKDLQELQAAKNPRFRIVLHVGEVAMGGSASMGEESLMGKEVNTIFRMEKLASTLSRDGLMSEAAKTRLHAALKTEDAGTHILQGFSEPARYFSF